MATKPSSASPVPPGPDETHARILLAAEEVLAARGPETTSLKEVASKAGVSLTILKHHFVALDALMLAVLERRLERTRHEAMRLAGVSELGLETLITLLFTQLNDPVHIRLMTWVLLSSKRDQLVAIETGTLAPLLALISERRKEVDGADAATATPQAVALDVMLTMTAGYGFALAGDLFANAMGCEPIPGVRFSERLASVFGVTPSP